MKLLDITHTASLASFVAVALAASGQAFAQSTPPPDLGDVLKTMPISPEMSKLNGLRFTALRETGTSYGAQAGLARRSHENQQRLQSRASDLDTTYNFQSLMIDGNVVPPVLTEVSDFYDQTNGDMLRVIGKVFRIDQQARFSYTAPNWRTYLLVGYEFDTNAVANVTPQTAEERQVWDAAVRLGFDKGREQADGILKDNFARLQRDYVGMVRYHQMLDAGMVSAPFVASSSTAVARAEDGAMHVGEVFLRITAAPDFVAEPSRWKGGEKGSANARLQSGAMPTLPEKVLPKPKK
jgi:defect in organelle trafficking protein DotC